jgi:hypothetical protein
LLTYLFGCSGSFDGSRKAPCSTGITDIEPDTASRNAMRIGEYA